MTDLKRPRNIAADMIDALETATRKWTRQKKSEERRPGMIRHRVSRLTKVARTTLKDAVWEVLTECYMAASADDTLPAKVRQIFYQVRPKVIEERELEYGYFSQTLVPDYVEERDVDWNIVYDARGHFEEPHTNRRIGCGTIEVRNYLEAMQDPSIVDPGISDASIDIIGPSGGFSAVLYCEKEGFDPLFKAVDLANRYDLLIISNKGVSVTAARKLIDVICGENGLPLFVLHDFDVAGFMIFGTLQRDTRRYQFENEIEVIDLGLRLADIEGLEREPAARTRTSAEILRGQLRENGATEEEIEILLHERVELNAMTSDALVAMIERKLQAHGLEKAVPDDDTLAETYRAFHRSQQLRAKFEKLSADFKQSKIKVPDDLGERVRAMLDQHKDLRWDDAVRGERQFRRELFEWVKRRAFYHAIDVDTVRSALDKLASALGLAAHSYQEQDHIDVVTWLQDYLKGPNLNEKKQFGVALVAVMYHEDSREYALQVALLSKAIEMQGGWDEWVEKVWRGQETISRLELRKAEREAVEWLRTNYPDQTRLVEQETNRQFDAEIDAAVES
jgi:hypothetical protein